MHRLRPNLNANKIYFAKSVEKKEEVIAGETNDKS